MNWVMTYEHSLASLGDGLREAATSLLTLSAFFGDAFAHEDFFQHYCSAFSRGESDGAGGDRPPWLSLFLDGSGRWDLLAYRKCVTELRQAMALRAHGGVTRRRSHSTCFAGVSADSP